MQSKNNERQAGTSEILPPNRIGSEERLCEALRLNRGIPAYAATALGVSRQAVWQYMKKRPHLIEFAADLKETQVDISEAKLFQAIDKGDVRAIIFHLRTIGKDRGYVERTEVTGENGGALQMVHSMGGPRTKADVLLDGFDDKMLNRDEKIALSELMEKIEKADDVMVLTAHEYTHMQALVSKGKPKAVEAEAIVEAEAVEQQS